MNNICTLGPPRTGSGPSEKILPAPLLPRKGELAKNLYIDFGKADSVAERLGLGLEGLICTIDK